MSAIADLATHKEQHVTVAELAAYWRVSDRAVQYWVSKGSLPATKVGRSIRIRTDDARKFGRIDDIITGPIASER